MLSKAHISTIWSVWDSEIVVLLLVSEREEGVIDLYL